MKAVLISTFFLKTIFIVVLMALACLNISFAQLKIPDTRHLKARANTQIVIKNIDFTNNGTLALAASTTVKMTGNAAQKIEGSGTIAFNSLTIDNTAGVSLDQDISASGTLLMSSGDLDLKDKNVDLGTTGSLSGETNTSRIKVTPVAVDGNDGRIKATRTLVSGPNNNIAGLRLDINTDSYTGEKTIFRGHQILAGTGNQTGNTSSSLYYILPGIEKLTSGHNISINYLDDEVDGFNEEDLLIFQKIERIDDPNPWFTPVTSIVTTGDKKIASADVACPYYTCSAIVFHDLIALASSDSPLPVDLYSFTSVCDGNKIILKWVLVSENNNHYFNIERSTDAQNWTNLSLIIGAGTTNTYTYYSFEDSNTEANVVYYYRLSDVDFDGRVTYHPYISASCNSSIDYIYAYPNPANKDIQILIESYQNRKISYFITDILGRTLIKDNVNLEKGTNKISIDVSYLSDAMYMLHVLSDDGQFITAKQIVIKKY